MSTTKDVNLTELSNASQVGNSDASPEVQPQSSTVLCSATISILTSPTVSTAVTAAAGCFDPNQ